MSNGNQNKDRKPFTIDLEEHLEFKGIASTMLRPSNEFCRAVSDLFRGVFADFEGCMFEVPQTMFDNQNVQVGPYFTLIFNHGNYDNDAIVACARANGTRNGDHGVVARNRYRDAQLNNGDRYFLNDDGKDVIKPLLLPRFYNQGNPKWNNIVSEYAENSGIYGYPSIQYTKVSFIDPNRLCSLLFGEKDGDDHVEYQVSIFGPTNTFAGQLSNNFLLSILKVSEKEVYAAYEKLGLGTVSRIIK